MEQACTFEPLTSTGEALCIPKSGARWLVSRTSFLGRGESGDAYRLTMPPESNSAQIRDIVMKTFNMQDYPEDFCRELAMNRILHVGAPRNIVTCHGSLRLHYVPPGVERGPEPKLERHALLFELVGTTLADKLKDEKGFESIEEILRGLADICDALTGVHRCGICYHDIHIDNILIQGGVWMLSDFGFSMFHDETGRPVPQSYLPPELYLNRRAGAHSDIWRLCGLGFDLVLRFIDGEHLGTEFAQSRQSALGGNGATPYFFKISAGVPALNPAVSAIAEKYGTHDRLQGAPVLERFAAFMSKDEDERKKVTADDFGKALRSMADKVERRRV